MWWILGLFIYVILGTIYNLRKRPKVVKVEFQEPELIRKNESVLPKPEVEIIYKDREGSITKRKITIHSVKEVNGDLLAGCYCYKRNELRSFYVSKMSEFVVLKTGQIITDPASYFREKFSITKVG